MHQTLHCIAFLSNAPDIEIVWGSLLHWTLQYCWTHSIAFPSIAPDITFALVFAVGILHWTLQNCWMHSIAFLSIAPDIAFASVFEVGTSHRTLKYCWTQSIAFLSIAPDIAFALVFEVGAKATFSAAQLHAKPCKRSACQFYIMLMPNIIFIIIIIMNTRPKPAYGRQDLAGSSFRASGAQLGSGK